MLDIRLVIMTSVFLELEDLSSRTLHVGLRLPSAKMYFG